MQLLSQPIAQESHIGKKDLEVFKFNAGDEAVSQAETMSEMSPKKNLEEDIAVLIKNKKRVS